MTRTGAWVLLLGFLLAACGLPAQSYGGSSPIDAQTATVRTLVDINGAGAEELKQLPGIADAYAAAIIRNRPYKNKTQLNTRKVIPLAAYKKIRNLIIAKQ